MLTQGIWSDDILAERALMMKDPVEADLGNLVDGIQRVPDTLELKRRAIEGLHGPIQSRHWFRARPSR